jgi:DNA-binding transcriptional MerR regulator
VRDHRIVITIGQLARYVGVSTKTVRVYHDKGLLPEPGRDASGYRRYTAQDAIELIKIRTLAEAGVPLAKIVNLKAAPADVFQRALAQIDDDLTARIRSLRNTQRRLRRLASGHTLLPAEIDHHLHQLGDLGFSERWVKMEGDLWILVYVTHPDIALELFRDQAQQLTDPSLRQLYLDYDRAHDLDPHDPFLVDLARRIVQATAQRYGTRDLPGQAGGSELPQLIQGAVNASSPAWQRLDSLIRDELRRSSER